jgi:hypothetical protein
LLGLVGLFMSVCGGGFLIRMTYGAVTNIVHSGHWQEWPGVLILLAFPAAFATGGAVLCWVSARYLRKQIRAHDRDDR